MKPFSSAAKEMSSRVSLLLKDKLLRTSHQVYFNLDPRILAILLKLTPPASNVTISDLYVKKLRAYLEGLLPYNSVAEAVHLLGRSTSRNYDLTWTTFPGHANLKDIPGQELVSCGGISGPNELSGRAET